MPGRVLTPTDCHGIVNGMVAQMAVGGIAAVNSSNFVSVGETLLRAGTENVLNALSLVLGKTLVATRPYKAKLNLINGVDSGAYANRIRKISYFSRYAEPSGMFNTNLYTNLAMGYDNGSNSGNSVASMWEQNQPVPLEMNFGGSSVWDYHTTIYEEQLKEAFRSEESFGRFVSGYLTEAANDVEQEKEAFNRVVLLNYLGGLYDLSMYVDLVADFNSENNTTYTRAQVLAQPVLKDFMEFYVRTIKKYSDFLEQRTALYHAAITKTVNGVTYNLLRHTPKDKQRMLMLKDFWRKAETQVLSEIFNDDYLKLENFEGVDFWQAIDEPSKINITPAIIDLNDLTTQTAGSAVQLDYVVGALFDEDALMTNFQLESVYTTPVEARKGYRNVFTHIKRNLINDFSENGILFFLGAGGP